MLRRRVARSSWREHSSHLLEHMVFKGTAAPQRARDRAVARGARRLAGRVYVARAHVVSGARARRASLERAPDVIGDSCFSPLLRRERSRARAQGRARGDRDGGRHAGRSRVRAAQRGALGRASVRLLDPRHARHGVGARRARSAGAARPRVPSRRRSSSRAAGNVDARAAARDARADRLERRSRAADARSLEVPPGERGCRRRDGTSSARARRRTSWSARRRSAHGDPRRYALSAPRACSSAAA